jgi:hypothetical protein
LLLEHSDDFIEDSILFKSLCLFFSIGLSLVVKIINGGIEGRLGLLNDDVALSDLGKGSLDLSCKSISKDCLSLVFSG